MLRVPPGCPLRRWRHMIYSEIRGAPDLRAWSLINIKGQVSMPGAPLARTTLGATRGIDGSPRLHDRGCLPLVAPC